MKSRISSPVYDVKKLTAIHMMNLGKSNQLKNNAKNYCYELKPMSPTKLSKRYVVKKSCHSTTTKPPEDTLAKSTTSTFGEFEDFSDGNGGFTFNNFKTVSSDTTTTTSRDPKYVAQCQSPTSVAIQDEVIILEKCSESENGKIPLFADNKDDPIMID